MRKTICVAIMAGLAGGALAQEVVVPVETTKTAKETITLKLYPFLTAEETQLLRIMASHEEARAQLVPAGSGHGAIAVAPKEGLVRGGLPVPSAVAVGNASDATAAAENALARCNEAKKRGPDCVVVLAVAPL